MNAWGKTPRGEKYSDGIEFRNRKNQPFDWENEKLAETLPEVEEPIYPDILAEVPGLVLESDITDEDDAVLSPAPPTFEEEAAASFDNSGVPTDLTEITGVHGQFTGVDNDISFPVTSPTGIEDPIVARTTPPNPPLLTDLS